MLPWHTSTLLLFHLNTANSLLWLTKTSAPFLFEYQSARGDELILSPAIYLNLSASLISKMFKTTDTPVFLNDMFFVCSPFWICYMFSNFTIVWNFFLFFQLSDSKCLLHSLLKSLKICEQLGLVILLFLSFSFNISVFLFPHTYISQGFTIFCKQSWYQEFWGIWNIEIAFLEHYTWLIHSLNMALESHFPQIRLSFLKYCLDVHPI